MYYSKSTGGFYSAEIHGAREIQLSTPQTESGEEPKIWTEPNPDCKIPADAVEITAELHISLLNAQSNGKVIQPDENGCPVALDPTPTPITALIDIAIQQIRRLRVGVFSTLAGMQSEAIVSGDVTTAKAIASIQGKLRDLPEIDLSDCVTVQDVNDTVNTAWRSISDASPVTVQSAFAGIAT